MRPHKIGIIKAEFGKSISGLNIEKLQRYGRGAPHLPTYSYGPTVTSRENAFREHVKDQPWNIRNKRAENYNARDAALHIYLHITADQQSPVERPRSGNMTRTNHKLSRINEEKIAGAKKKGITRCRKLGTTRLLGDFTHCGNKARVKYSTNRQ